MSAAAGGGMRAGGGMSAVERTERARLAANVRWSRPGERARQSATIRAAYRARLAAAVDPDGLLGPAELDAAVANAARAAMARLRTAKRDGGRRA